MRVSDRLESTRVTIEERRVHRSWVVAMVGAALAALLLSRIDLKDANVLLEGWSLAMTAIAAASIAFWIFDRRPTLIIDSVGFFDRRTGVETVPWTQIERAERCGVREIRLVLRAPLAAVPKNAAFPTEESRMELLTNAWGLRIGRDELLEMLQEALLERVLHE